MILHGANYDEAYGYALALCQRAPKRFCSPFTDDEVMAGQGTVALEMLVEQRDLGCDCCTVVGGIDLRGIGGSNQG